MENSKVCDWIAISGKRFSGKDFFANILAGIATNSHKKVLVLHLANEFKRFFAETAQLDYEKLLNDRDYKVGAGLFIYS